ncbi:MAG: hypothetical protein ABIH83_01715 [Candidatus Micrarchaeota archaeon]
MKTQKDGKSDITVMLAIPGKPHLRVVHEKMRIRGKNKESFESALARYEIKGKLPIKNETSSIICALNPKNKHLVDKAYFEGRGPFKHKECNIYFALFDKVQEEGFWLLFDTYGQGVVFEY